MPPKKHKVDCPSIPGYVMAVTVNKTRAQWVASQKKFDDTIAGLSFIQREEMFELCEEHDHEMLYAYTKEDFGPADDEDWEVVPLGVGIHTFPPSEEAFLQSHADREAIMHQLMEGMKPGRGDPRTRSHRVQRQIDAWESPLPLFVDAYLQYNYIGTTETVGLWPLNVVGFNKLGLRLFSHTPRCCGDSTSAWRESMGGGEELSRQVPPREPRTGKTNRLIQLSLRGDGQEGPQVQVVTEDG
ncbi:hypothetical protein B0H14DRAFT_3652786 [Mycena olivaceomarginata]|nr:hypothetical protein B0H14DRAFT_3652786 [Mycena olivaceomarginata]